MWSATVDGRPLTFHLAGINNQNFIMRDDETGSWWQQVTGEAIFGPLAGKHLDPVTADEVSFHVWRAEHPVGRVLVPDESAPWRRFSEDWEAQTATLPVRSMPADSDALDAREVVLGVKLNGAAKAFPLARLREAGVIVDRVGSIPVVLLLASDATSARVFEGRVDGRDLEFFRETGATDVTLDSAGDRWDFAGRAVSGPLAGRQLQRVDVLRDYWFDWKTYHPDTAVYTPST